MVAVVDNGVDAPNGPFLFFLINLVDAYLVHLYVGIRTQQSFECSELPKAMHRIAAFPGMGYEQNNALSVLCASRQTEESILCMLEDGRQSRQSRQ